MENIKVCKFGGSSVGDAEQVMKVNEIIGRDSSRKVIVVSAPKGVTNDLIRSAEHFAKYSSLDSAILDSIKGKYRAIMIGVNRMRGVKCDADDYSVLNTMFSELEDRITLCNVSESGIPKEYMAGVKAWGEETNARLIAELFRDQGFAYIGPKDALFLKGDFDNAKIMEESYSHLHRKIHDAFKHSKVIIFPGFFGYNKDGKIATFSRGGSDLTGAILANAIDASIYENWTDTDGIKVIDPRLVEGEVPTIKQITYDEIRELAYMGFKVYHQEAMFPTKEKNIPINIKNTNNPSNPGTLILDDRVADEPLVGIAMKKGFCYFRLKKLYMNDEIGFGERLLRIFKDEGIPYEHLPGGVDTMSLVVEQSYFSDPLHVNKIERKIRSELEADVDVQFNKALIVTVGKGMINQVGMAYRITGAFARENVNINLIDQGASQLSITFGVDEKDADNALKSIYREFFAK